MTVPKYIKLLNQLKDKSISNWSDLTPIERDLVDSSYQWLIDNLNISKGIIEQDAELQASMDSFVNSVVDILRNNSGYQSKLSSFLTDMRNISKNMETFHATTNNLDLSKLGLTDIQKTVTNEVLDQYLDNGLSAHFVQPLRESVYRNILLGASMKDIKQTLNAYIISGKDKSGKLQQYVHNTAMQAVDTYEGYINQKLAATFDYTGYIISGSLIETSSKQCIYAVEHAVDGYMDKAQWEKVLEMARNNKQAKLIPGTTLKTLPLNRLHWFCRHSFTPIIMHKDIKP